ncbi:hypothetical protein N9L68_03700 [bacterium]|nr:hypothetical protein [bacterium]
MAEEALWRDMVVMAQQQQHSAQAARAHKPAGGMGGSTAGWGRKTPPYLEQCDGTSVAWYDWSVDARGYSARVDERLQDQMLRAELESQVDVRPHLS